MPIKVSEHYSIVTPQSAAHGEHAETGTLDTGALYTFKELVDYIERIGFIHASMYPIRSADDAALAWIETDGDESYHTGARTYRTLHLDRDQHPRYAKYWHKALKLAGVIR